MQTDDAIAQKMALKVRINIDKARIKALDANKVNREKYLAKIQAYASSLKPLLNNVGVAKIILAVLYLGKGSKTTGWITLGNSNPQIIEGFLQLMRRCYDVEESKFRCTVQLKADQNIEEIEQFWSKITKIPKNQFYSSRVDPRTVGIPTRKLDYRGVCRIDYFSADIFQELMAIGKIITMGP